MQWMLCDVLCHDQHHRLQWPHLQHARQSAVNASVSDHAVPWVQLCHCAVCCHSQQDAATRQHLHVHAATTEVHSVELCVVCAVSLVALSEVEAVDLFRHLLSDRANTQDTQDFS